MAYSSIVKPSDYFNTKLYTGTGSSNAITGVGFQPDFTWIKQRSNAENHALFDVVRGVTKYVKSDETALEVTEASSLSAFGTDGFTVVSSGKTNTSGRTYASWNWLGANGTASNSDGSITSTVSANTTAGFSIIDFTGNETDSTVGHGLGVAPSMFIMKRYTDDGYSTSTAWYTYHKSLASNKYLELQTSSSVGTNDGSLWNTSTPVTSSVINIGFNANSNHTGNKTIIYAFAEKKGYSKFGGYKGNGSTDGTFVYTGFSPSFILWKSSSNAEHWWIIDNKTTTYNPTNNLLRPDISDAELVGNANMKVDFLSNGFKLRQTDNALNGSGVSYIYMAFAEEPLVSNSGTDGVPATAR